MTVLGFSLRLCCAVLFGLLIGVERQLTGHTAGVRINVLVCAGACMFTLFSAVVGAPDPSRVAAQVVTGVGFLCSGIIFKEGLSVRGLNTAATIWCTAAIGVLTSTGRVAVGAVATAVLLVANVLLRPLASLVRPLDRFDDGEHRYLVNVTCGEEQEFGMRGLLLKLLEDSRLRIQNLESRDLTGGGVEIRALLLCRGRRRDDAAEALAARLGAEQGITAAGWKLLE